MGYVLDCGSASQHLMFAHRETAGNTIRVFYYDKGSPSLPFQPSWGDKLDMADSTKAPRYLTTINNIVFYYRLLPGGSFYVYTKNGDEYTQVFSDDFGNHIEILNNQCRSENRASRGSAGVLFYINADGNGTFNDLCISTYFSFVEYKLDYLELVGYMQYRAPLSIFETYCNGSNSLQRYIDEHLLVRDASFYLSPWIGDNHFGKKLVEQGILPDDVESFEYWLDSIEDDPQKDPYGDLTGYSTSGGGDGVGEYGLRDEDIPEPFAPSLSALDTGFVHAYSPNSSQLRLLSSFMWSDAFDLATLKKMFGDAMNAIIGLNIMPLAIPTDSTRRVYVGNVDSSIDMPVITSQYIKVDCGTVHIEKLTGSYLDYSPYTKCNIFIPFCGFHPLDIDISVDNDISLKYQFDILNGGCCAWLKVNNKMPHIYTGQASINVPFSGSDMSGVISNVLQIAGNVGSMVASGGISAPAVVGAAFSTATNVMGMKESVAHSGSVSGAPSLISERFPFVYITRPRSCIPKEQVSYMGYPSYMTVPISELSGYTEVEEVHIENVPCTDVEKKEIETLLKGGVFF